MILQNNRYVLLFDEKFQTNVANFKIHLNYELFSMFGFVCDRSTLIDDYYTIQINYDYIASYNSCYYISEIQRPINTIFPFVKCMILTNINIDPLNYSINTNSTNLTSKPVITSALVTDFDFQVANPDDFYNSISYVANNYDRQIMILNNYVTADYITFECKVITPDGYTCNIRQRRGAYSNIFFTFIPAE
jgi:hypothetical protein